MMASDRERVFGDAVYEAWRSGLNPDAVSRDELAYSEALGYEPEEAIERELRRIRPHRQGEDSHE